MLKEVAINPEVLLRWSKDRRDYLYFDRNYGIGTPRIISSFPKTRYKTLKNHLLPMVHQLDSDMDKKRYISMVEKLQNNIHFRFSEVNSDKDWGSLILGEFTNFDYVISNKDINCHNFIDIYNIDESDLIDLNTQLLFKRKKEEFFQVIEGFIRLTNTKFIIIDPYAWKLNSRKIIIDIIHKMTDRNLESVQIELIVIYKDNPRDKVPIASFYKDSILGQVNDKGNKVNVSVYHLSETAESEAFHNRYLLNDLGGIMLGHGIDIADLENDTNKKDVATLLNKELYEHLWDQFNGELKFEVISYA